MSAHRSAHRGHDHQVDDHQVDDHGAHDHHAHDHHVDDDDAHGHGLHRHEHPSGLRGVLHGLFVPHSHDSVDSIDDALTANAAGIRALKISLLILGVTTVLQAVIVAFSGSVALLADTVHNLADALTAVPLWIVFVLGRRVATRRYTYGYSRAEDLAGLFIVVVVALSAIVTAWQSIDRLVNPRPIENVGWVIAAGLVGCLGNEWVAMYRIRVGRQIGSAALVADGVHARTDGFASLAVVIGGLGVLAGFPLADPIVGLLIAGLIGVLLVGTVRSVGRRLMDGIEPELLDQVEHALRHVEHIDDVERLRLRWVGHRLHGQVVVRIADVPLGQANQIAKRAEQSVRRHLPNLDEISIQTLVGRCKRTGR